MKILFVNTNDNYGGAARAAVRIMRGVQRCGIDAKMFVKYKHTPAPDVLSLSQYVQPNWLLDCFKWVVRKIKNRWYYYKWRPYRKTKNNVILSDLRGIAPGYIWRKFEYDIVHLNWLNMRFIDVRHLENIHKPIVWTLHDSWAFCGLCHYFLSCEKYQTHCGACPMLGSKKEKDFAYEVFEQKVKAYKNLDLHIVTPSKWLGECVKKSAILGRFPVAVIPNCLDTEVFQPMPKRCKHVKPVILYGAMNAATDKIKGFTTLLAALRMLDKQGLEANLMVFGAEAQELPMQFEHIDVTFVGYIKNNEKLVEVYSDADVMVVPSYSEVFGQTASEAMACGTPVVAFRCTGIQDVVDEGCGYLAEPYSPEDLAKGIRYCIENNPDNVIGKAARESAVKRYAIDVVAKQYKQLYESLV